MMHVREILHKDLMKRDLDSIIKLKKQHWDYSDESQRQWINDNHNAKDIHFLLEDNGLLKAYLSLTIIESTMDEDPPVLSLGVGNVCTDKNWSKQGYGRAVCNAATAYMKDNSMNGLLLCGDNTIPFYKKLGWISIDAKEAFVAGKPYGNNVMSYGNGRHKCYKISINRNF